MARFDYVRAGSISEAVQLLNEPGVVSKPLAGGTDILVYIRQIKPWFERLVDISQLQELTNIEQIGTEIRVGAAVTFSQVTKSKLLKRAAPFLVEACQSVGSLQIRNQGTLGGNVINAAACADSLPPLVCLDAIAHLRSAKDERRVAVGEFITRPNRSDVRDGELLTHISFTLPPDGVRSSFIKLGRRNAQSISRLSMAAMGRTNAANVIDFVRLTPGAATPRTIRFEPVEALLLNQHPSEELMAAAGKKTAEVMIETTGRRWSTAYKEIAIQALAERTLRAVILNGHGQR